MTPHWHPDEANDMTCLLLPKHALERSNDSGVQWLVVWRGVGWQLLNPDVGEYGAIRLVHRHIAL